MTLAQLRSMVRRRLKSGNDTVRYTDYASNILLDPPDTNPGDIDDAIMIVGNDFVTRTHCTRKASTATLAVDTQEVTLAISLFRPEFLIEGRALYISESADYSAADVECGFTRAGLEEIAHKRARCGTSSGVPRFIHFSVGNAQAIVYPPPKAAGTLNLIWSQPFIPALADIATPSTAVNIPEDLLVGCVERMVVEVQWNELEQMERDQKLAAYEAHVERSRGKGNLGSNVIIRESTSSLRRWAV